MRTTLKYVLNRECPRKRKYCLEKNVPHYEECKDLKEVERVLRLFSPYDNIMITGGEPTLSPLFAEKLIICKDIFQKVDVTTANPEFLSNPINRLVDDITFSLHGDLKNAPSVTHVRANVYLSIVHHWWPYQTLEYSREGVSRLKLKGYLGLTIEFNGWKESPVVPCVTSFSIRLHERSVCTRDRIFIMPDMSIEHDFEKYLGVKGVQS